MYQNCTKNVPKVYQKGPKWKLQKVIPKLVQNHSKTCSKITNTFKWYQKLKIMNYQKVYQKCKKCLSLDFVGIEITISVKMTKSYRIFWSWAWWFFFLWDILNSYENYQVIRVDHFSLLMHIKVLKKKNGNLHEVVKFAWVKVHIWIMRKDDEFRFVMTKVIWRCAGDLLSWSFWNRV